MHVYPLLWVIDLGVEFLCHKAYLCPDLEDIAKAIGPIL